MSKYEDMFAAEWKRIGGFYPEREFKFHPERKWRFDFAWPEADMAVEIDGGGWMRHGGRHARSSDYLKRNQATMRGWRVLYFTKDMIEKNVEGCVSLALSLYQAQIALWSQAANPSAASPCDPTSESASASEESHHHDN